ncbi:MAG TPA: beta-(1-6) glucans synthase [Pseudorhodoplanes sp.]|nr:beta-(1-6) glucans synthase [Pseudorhodoplanes sp.]
MTEHSLFRFAIPAALFACAVAVIAAAWWWMGQPVAMPPSPLAQGEKLYCVSYAPFRGTQSPLSPPIEISPGQIDDDLARLSKITDCVRTYAVEFGLDQIAGIAKRHGLKVLQGIWIGGNAEKNKVEIDTALRLARQFPDTIGALIVGNEVLLRGEMTAQNLAATIRSVKSRTNVPVTYADVWEFWLRSRDVYDAVDFVTIHILPYWEDLPISARDSVSHLDSVRKKVAAAFPNKDILIGETGFPSAGRMREGAEPSPSNQAKVIHDIIALAKRDKFRVNVIEAFDQPWKRQLEGTVGGHWGLFDAGNRAFKFAWGEPLSDHPHWRQQIAGGVLMAALVFGAALLGRIWLTEPMPVPASRWVGIAVIAGVAGIFVPLSAEKLPLESLGIAGWVRGGAMFVLALACPLAVAAAITRERSAPSFGQVLTRDPRTFDCRLRPVLGLLLVAMTLAAVLVALGLVFDPRYKDFPYAPLTAAIVPFVVLALVSPPADGPRALAEHVAAGTLALSLIYIAYNESVANWQSLWLCGLLALLAFRLQTARDAQDSKS